MFNLCQNLSVSKKLPLTCINQEICGQKPNLYAILWKIMTFIKFCGDYYDIYENKRIFISNASWEILNRTLFNSTSKYNGKKNIKNEKNIFYR